MQAEEEIGKPELPPDNEETLPKSANQVAGDSEPISNVCDMSYTCAINTTLTIIVRSCV